MKRRVQDDNNKSSNNSNNNLLRWIQTKMTSLLGNHKVGPHTSLEFINNVPLIKKPHQSSRVVSENRNRKKMESMMRILRSPIAFGYFQAYLTTEEENKCQYLKFYLACKDLIERHENFTNTLSHGSGQLELFQFRQKARVMHIWQTFLEKNGDDGCAIVRHTSDLGTPSEKATSPFVAYDEAVSNEDIPAEEISKATSPTAAVRMAVAIHNISRPQSRPQSRSQSRKHNNNGCHGPPSTHSSFVVSNSDKGPSKRLAQTSTVSEQHHRTFLPTKVVRNIAFKMERADECTWGPDIFTEAVDTTLNILYDTVFPKFRQSLYFTKMMQREKYLFEEGDHALPHAHNLQIRSPPSQIIEMLSMGRYTEESIMTQYAAGRHYTLEEIMEEGMFYEELLCHLSKSYSADSLMCVRMITIFKELLLKATAAVDKSLSPQISSANAENVDVVEPPGGQCSPIAGGGGGAGASGRRGVLEIRKTAKLFFDKNNNSALHTAVEEHAWLIYCNCVAVGSCYEIAIAPKCREAVMMSLAVPHLLMFAELEASAYADLSSQFRDFKNTVSYELMGRRAVAAAISRTHGISMGGRKATARALNMGPKKYPVAASAEDYVEKDMGPRWSGV